MIRTRNVSRRYGTQVALDSVTLDIDQRGVVGLLGPNGAGKSTLINLLVGLRKPTSGTVELFGGDPRDPRNRRRIGVTPQETGLPPTLKVRECVAFVAAHYADPVRTGELLDRFQISELAGKQTGALSGGQKRRLAVALAFVGKPDVVFLDEPSTGLDVESRKAMWDVIKRYPGMVLLTSHYLEEIEALADRVIVLGHGRVLADDTVERIRSMVGMRRVSFIAAHLPSLTGVVSVEHDDARTSLMTTDADLVVRELVQSGVAFSGLEVEPTSLEDAFLTLTTVGG